MPSTRSRTSHRRFRQRSVFPLQLVERLLPGLTINIKHNNVMATCQAHVEGFAATEELGQLVRVRGRFRLPSRGQRSLVAFTTTEYWEFVITQRYDLI